MSAVPNPVPNPAPLGLANHLSQAGLIAISWAGVGLSLLFVVARSGVRFYKADGLAGDDYWIYFAWSILTINAILQTIQMPHLYYLAFASAGLVPIDEKLIYHGNLYVRYEFASIGLFWTILWSVKASFLVIFWKLFKGLPTYKRWWVCVAIFTFLAYVGCWISSILNCHPASQYFDFGQCLKPIDVRGAVISVSYSTAVDILTDFMIMAMPLSLLYRIQISNKQKIGLATVFSLALIIIITAIIRAVEITKKARTDPALLALWSIIESTVAIIVGCLPPFKTLFSSRFSTSNRYLNTSKNNHNSQNHNTSSSRGRNTSIPLLHAPESAYRVRARGTHKEFWERDDSRVEMVRKRDEEGGGGSGGSGGCGDGGNGGIGLGEGEIRVERVFSISSER